MTDQNIYPRGSAKTLLNIWDFTDAGIRLFMYDRFHYMLIFDEYNNARKSVIRDIIVQTQEEADLIERIFSKEIYHLKDKDGNIKWRTFSELFEAFKKSQYSGDENI